MTTTNDAGKLLLPALLAMDVYHQDVKGGIKPETDGKTKSIDSVNPLGPVKVVDEIGFVAKTYSVGNTVYLVYRGTDDGALDVLNNPRQIGSTLVSEFTGATPIVPDLYYGYPMAIGALSSLNIADAGSPTGYNSQAIQAVRYYKQVRDANPNKEIVIAAPTDRR
jgi:hypothetical protein